LMFPNASGRYFWPKAASHPNGHDHDMGFFLLASALQRFAQSTQRRAHPHGNLLRTQVADHASKQIWQPFEGWSAPNTWNPRVFHIRTRFTGTVAWCSTCCRLRRHLEAWEFLALGDVGVGKCMPQEPQGGIILLVLRLFAGCRMPAGMLPTKLWVKQAYGSSLSSNGHQYL
jgi:hypothetical protein